MPVWVVEGVILAAALPFDGFGGLGQCSVGPIPKNELNDYYQSQPYAIPFPDNPQTYEIPFAATANQIGFYALHRITTTLTVQTLDEALADAESRFRRVAVALAIVGSPIRDPSCSVRIVRWQELDEATGTVTRTGAPKSLIKEGRRAIEVVAFDKMSQAIDLASLADRDQVVGRLFETWYRAEQVYLVAGRQDDRRWAVIEYARLLEDVAHQIVPVAEGGDYEDQMKQLGSSLVAELTAAGSVEQIRRAVKHGHDTMATIRQEVTRLRIAEAGRILNLPLEASTAAARTWVVRSRNAAHARVGVISEEEVYLARAAAAVYLVGYIKRRGAMP